jgi:hypothetical protein
MFLPSVEGIERIIVTGCADFGDVISVMMIELQEGA